MNEDVTLLLREMRDGNSTAEDRLYSVVYPQLRKLARSHRRNWDGNETLDTTSLIHEAFIKLAGAKNNDWNDRKHFFGTAARAMRQILINYAKERAAEKRGGGVADLTLNEERVPDPKSPDAILAVHQALEELERFDERLARVFECRRFASYTIKETAMALNISEATVKRDYERATAWLRRALTSD